MAVTFLTNEDKAVLDGQITALSEEKLNKNLGAENAGSALIVGADGNVIVKSDAPDTVTYRPTLDGILSTNGSIKIDNNYYYVRTDYVSLDGYSKIKGQCTINNVGYAIAFFTSDLTIMADVSIIGAGTSDYQIIDMDVPAGAAYCMLSHYGGSKANGAAIARPDAFLMLIAEDAPLLNDPLYGKVINALGNSITSTNYTTPNWWQLIAEKTGAEFNNYGVSGTCLAHYEPRETTHGKCFVHRCEDMDTGADAVIVMGGTNDGLVERGAWDSTDETTFFGALNVLLTRLLTLYPGKPILVCTPVQPSNAWASNVMDALKALADTAETATMSAQLRAEAIRVKCRQYGIPCLDLFNESGLNGADTDKVYYRTDDNLHPSAVGMERMASIIRAKLETLFR